jgi:uncharacterized membrane-anchored protein YitT (DUF2179 family)
MVESSIIAISLMKQNCYFFSLFISFVIQYFLTNIYYLLFLCFRLNKYFFHFTVAPQWVMEPQDVATLAGGSLMVHCQAQGFPQPQITWMRRHGKGTRHKYFHFYTASIWHTYL